MLKQLSALWRRRRLFLEVLGSIFAALELIKEKLDQMNKDIQKFVTDQTAHNKRVSDGIDGIADDVKNMQKQITDLTASIGDKLEQEDKDALQALTDTGETLAEKVEALDNLNPPPAPPASTP